VLPLSTPSIFSFLQGHPVAAYVFSLVFPSFILTLNLYKYRPLVRFSPTVGKCNTSERNRQCLFTYQVQTCCEHECLPNKPSSGNSTKSIHLVPCAMHNYWRICQIQVVGTRIQTRSMQCHYCPKGPMSFPT
jgi:hypothetical protein